VLLFIRQVEPFVLLEIHCHGGPEVLRLLESIFAARGIEMISAGDWDLAVHGRDRAEILDILSRCPTTRTAAIVLDQLNGAFGRALANIDALFAAARETEATAKLARLRELIPLGEHLARPWKVVVAGEPNVGKSSLVNALAGFTRSVVSPTPGTTRDVVSTTIALDGWPIELIDTAGLRETPDELEAEGIARARSACANADLTLRVVDATNLAPSEFNSGELLVINKIDLKRGASAPGECTFVSARNAIGLDLLVAAIVRHVVPSPPAAGEAVPITAGHRELIGRRGISL
jgi:tRNA modification GTPase